MHQSMSYNATHCLAEGESFGYEANFTVDHVIEIFGKWKLLAIVVIDYLAPGR